MNVTAWGCSSAGRASALHVEGLGFESPHLQISNDKGACNRGRFCYNNHAAPQFGLCELKQSKLMNDALVCRKAPSLNGM